MGELVAFRVEGSRTDVARIITDRKLLGKLLSEFHGDCERPVPLHLFGRPDRLMVELGLDPDKAVSEEISVRCRKCTACLAHRSRLWTARAIDEVKSSERTWFGTLTLNPDAAFVFRMRADARSLSSRCESLSMQSDAEQFQAIVEQVNPDLTKWLKRIRKASGAALRYLLVCEAHKTGVPHWHILVHEHQGSVTKRVLEQKWPFGFSHWRLCQGSEAAPYVCKYLAKSALTRVRASQNYGREGPRLFTARVLGSLAPVVGTGSAERKL